MRAGWNRLQTSTWRPVPLRPARQRPSTRTSAASKGHGSTRGRETMGKRVAATALAVSAGLSVLVAGCGGSSSGPPTLKYYSALDNGGTNIKAAKRCSAESGGKYVVKLVPLANSADASRELLVRRLAAKDSDIDLINMDTIWTPEFAEAGWLRELKGREKPEATNDVLPGPLKSVEWKGKTYDIPLNTNAQLLWYRKDLVKKPPET